MAKKKKLPRGQVTEIILRIQYAPEQGGGVKYRSIPAKGVIKLTLEGAGLQHTEYVIDHDTVEKILSHPSMKVHQAAWNSTNPHDRGSTLVRKASAPKPLAALKSAVATPPDGGFVAAEWEIFCPPPC